MPGRKNLAQRQRKLREEAQEKFEEQNEDVGDTRRRAAEDGARYKAYEAKYARQLGKKPSQLAPEERQWVRDHF